MSMLAVQENCNEGLNIFHYLKTKDLPQYAAFVNHSGQLLQKFTYLWFHYSMDGQPNLTHNSGYRT